MFGVSLQTFNYNIYGEFHIQVICRLYMYKANVQFMNKVFW